MDIEDLTHDEKIALVALVEFFGEADREVSEDEVVQIQGLVDLLGKEVYRQLCDEVDERFADEAALKSFLETIESRGARDLIFEKALEMAIANSIAPNESAMLEWLKATWQVRVEFSS